MKKTCELWAACVACCLLCVSAATAREFTDVQGRKLEGELVSVTGAQAVIKRTADGRQFTVMASQFSPEDQKFMAEFAASHMHYEFDVKFVKDKLGTSKSKEYNVTSSAEQWAYKLTVTNKSSGDADNLRMDYWLFLKADDGKIKSGPRIQQAGSINVGLLRHSATGQFQTKPLTVTKHELDGGFYYPDGTKNRSKDMMGGIAVRFFRGNTEVYAWASDPDLLKTARGKTDLEREPLFSQ